MKAQIAGLSRSDRRAALANTQQINDLILGLDAEVTALDSEVAALQAHTANLPTMIQAGAFAGTTDASGEIAVTYPQAFSSPAVVIPSLQTAQPNWSVVVSRTASGFRVRLYSTSGALGVDISRTVLWVAIGTAP